jgi:hypothetical protein
MLHMHVAGANLCLVYCAAVMHRKKGAYKGVVVIHGASCLSKRPRRRIVLCRPAWP